MFYDRNPESMRTVPGVCAAGRDSVNRLRRLLRLCPKIVVFFENSEVGQKIDPGASRGALRANFWTPWPKTDFLGLSTYFFFPQKTCLLDLQKILKSRKITRIPPFTRTGPRTRDPSRNTGSGGQGPGVRDLQFYIYLLPINRPCGRYVIFSKKTICP